MSVRPREMTVGANNPQAGEYPLGTVADYIVTVPAQCAGAQRCPLIVFLPAEGDSAREVTKQLRPFVNKFGVILLAATRCDSGVMDAALKETIGKFAIDPAKIGIFGHGISGSVAMRYGSYNPNVFSRIGSISGTVSVLGMDHNNKVEYFVDEAIGEHSPVIYWLLLEKQRAGVIMRVVMNFRKGDPQPEEYDFWGQWLQESWAQPNPDSRAVLPLAFKQVPILTAENLKQMTTFWTSFMHEPDSIRITARLAHLRLVGLHPALRRYLMMTDMQALADKYPSVAEDFKRAGLTPTQQEAYRAILVLATRMSFETDNYEFVLEHPKEYMALWSTGMWHTP